MEEDGCGKAVAGGGWKGDRQMEAAVIFQETDRFMSSASLDHPQIGDAIIGDIWDDI